MVTLTSASSGAFRNGRIRTRSVAAPAAMPMTTAAPIATGVTSGAPIHDASPPPVTPGAAPASSTKAT